MKRIFACFLIFSGLMMNGCSSNIYSTNGNLEKENNKAHTEYIQEYTQKEVLSSIETTKKEDIEQKEDIFDTSEIEEYLDNYTEGADIVSLVSYDDKGTIRLRATYRQNAMYVHLPRSIMAHIGEIEGMGYPVENLEVEFYKSISRWNDTDESVLLYKNSNLDNINIYVDDLGYVRSESFYKGSEIQILNEELYQDDADLLELYEYYEENK